MITFREMTVSLRRDHLPGFFLGWLRTRMLHVLLP